MTGEQADAAAAWFVAEAVDSGIMRVEDPEGDLAELDIVWMVGDLLMAASGEGFAYAAELYSRLLNSPKRR